MTSTGHTRRKVGSAGEFHRDDEQKTIPCESREHGDKVERVSCARLITERVRFNSEYRYMNLNGLAIEDQCMVHRYLYYVVGRPIISDYQYDMLEKKAVETADENHKIHSAGSDLASSYSDEIIKIAKTLI